MLTKAQANVLIGQIYSSGITPDLFELITCFTLTEKERNQEVLAANFLRETKRERKTKKYSRKAKHANTRISDLLSKEYEDYAADLYEMQMEANAYYDWYDYEPMEIESRRPDDDLDCSWYDESWYYDFSY